METKIYAILDNKTHIYGVPFFALNDVQASRILHVLVRDPQMQLSLFPQDFDLYQLGTYDDCIGKLTEGEHRFVVSAISFKQLTEEKKDGNVSESNNGPVYKKESDSTAVRAGGGCKFDTKKV